MVYTSRGLLRVALGYSTMRCGKELIMLLVSDSMARDIATLSPDETAATALALCRERRIRHLPVLSEGRLVGIVSDRDLRSSTPALGDPERATALEKVLVGDVMAREVVTVDPEDPIEQAANTMREQRIGCLPVLEGEELIGIVTASDVMEALVYLVGAHEPGSRMEVVLPDRPGSLAGAAGVFGMCGINIVSAAMGATREPKEEGAPRERIVVFRVDTIDTGEVVGYLEEAGYSVLWPPKP
jgi:acetoin utilization protein AcuB